MARPVIAGRRNTSLVGLPLMETKMLFPRQGDEVDRRSQVATFGGGWRQQREAARSSTVASSIRPSTEQNSTQTSKQGADSGDNK